MENEPKSNRRRRVPRRDFFRRVGLLVRGVYTINSALQIGEGGMLVLPGVALSIGQFVVVTFKIPGQLPNIISAVVKYELPLTPENAKPYGIEFINLDYSVRRDIRNYVASQKTPTVSSI